MTYPIRANIIPLFRHIVEAIRPFAEANAVYVELKTSLDAFEILYHPEALIPDLTLLLCRVITFTPQSFQVRLEVVAVEHGLKVQVINTGAYLVSLEDIHKELSQPIMVSKYGPEGTCFVFQLDKEETPLKGNDHF